MTSIKIVGRGISCATQIPLIWQMWSKLKSNGFYDRCSIRVFEGHIYSLMDDQDYYECSGFRKLINTILFYWDELRAFALKDEYKQDWISRNVTRTDEEQERICVMADALEKRLLQLE